MIRIYMLPLLPFERIAKKSGIYRITKDSLKELRDMMTDFSLETAENAVKISIHAKRNTVMAEDIRFVSEKKN